MGRALETVGPIVVALIALPVVLLVVFLKSSSIRQWIYGP
jgi:hypothetical protein